MAALRDHLTSRARRTRPARSCPAPRHRPRRHRPRRRRRPRHRRPRHRDDRSRGDRETVRASRRGRPDVPAGPVGPVLDGPGRAVTPAPRRVHPPSPARIRRLNAVGAGSPVRAPTGTESVVASDPLSDSTGDDCAEEGWNRRCRGRRDPARGEPAGVRRRLGRARRGRQPPPRRLEHRGEEQQGPRERLGQQHQPVEPGDLRRQRGQRKQPGPGRPRPRRQGRPAQGVGREHPGRELQLQHGRFAGRRQRLAERGLLGRLGLGFEVVRSPARTRQARDSSRGLFHVPANCAKRI
ncbi:hypothetical protein L7F22_037188 [Adiantum nelumboides]|nr:hypothetical protein [Adiantum nelumboides]